MACATLAISLGLSACMFIPKGSCWPSPLEQAASYDWMLNDRHYSKPLNTWVKNEKLEAFLLKSFHSNGLESLKAQYGFDCAPKPVAPACKDCFVCRTSLAKMAGEGEGNNLSLCAPIGEMLIQVDIGPGRDSFSVMTYWKRPELGPNAGKF
jgi:hypothetical protein